MTSPKISSKLPLPPPVAPVNNGTLMPGTGKIKHVKMDRRTANAKKKAALAEQGYVTLTSLVKSADIDYLREEWGFKTKEEVIRVSLKYLVEATKKGLRTIQLGGS